MRCLRVVIFGITGSIGTQTAKICKELGYKIVGCTYHTNKTLAKQMAKTYHIKHVLCTKTNTDYEKLIKQAKPGIAVNAIVGFAGLKATIACLKTKTKLALANKESVVVAGKLIFEYAKKHHIQIIPIDSEHTNLYYQLMQVKTKDVNQIYITGSGGKYLGWSSKQLKRVSYKEATTHKNWSMGNKITIDSNTLMNKCFEVIEAYWYFKTKRINVLHDKTSLIHSAILLNDGTFMYSHSIPTMTLPIVWALTNFEAPIKYLKHDAANATTDVLCKLNNVKPISFAYQVMNDKTNALGIVINAANEKAHSLFKQGKIGFDKIIPYIEKAMNKIKLKPIKTFKDVFDFDSKVRKIL